MIIKNSYRAFYTTVVQCKKCNDVCPGVIRNSSQEGWPPRGFYTEGQPRQIDFLIVGMNPGHPLDDEFERYAGKKPRDLVDAEMDIMRSRIVALTTGSPIRINDSIIPKTKVKFQNILIKRMQVALDCAPDKVFLRCALTNLVKCSTIQERTPRIEEAKKVCYETFFLEEVRLFPALRAIIALGDVVEEFLSPRLVALQRNIGRRIVLLPLPHPSGQCPTEAAETLRERITNLGD